MTVQHVEEAEKAGQYVTADDGGRLWTVANGVPGGPAFVLCHGGPGFWDYLEPVADVLDDIAWSVRWDQRGAGRSSQRAPYSVERCVSDMEAVRIQHGLERIGVFGHSWGATLGLQYALAYPERVDRLVYVSGTGLSWDWYPEYEARLQVALAPYQKRIEELRSLTVLTPSQEREMAVLRGTADFADPTFARAHAEDLVTPWFSSDPASNAAINAETRSWDEGDLVRRCRDLHVPTLIIDGASDPRPRWAVDSLYEALPDCRRVELATGHVPWADAPEPFAAVLREFVQLSR
jgi:proline iminopeptidase